MASITAETRGAVGLARLNRPEARNALSPELMEELAALCERWDEDPDVRCIVIAGSDEWFAAGADIKAMAKRTLRRRCSPRPPRASGRGWRRSGRRSSRPCPATRSAAAASWRWRAT